MMDQTALPLAGHKETSAPTLDVLLARQGRMVQHWPGDAVDARGLVRVAHATGKMPPIAWVFNGAIEFPALAEALGSDQPLIGMRSLHQILDADLLARNHAMDDLAEYYAACLIAKFGSVPLILGASCQAADIAYRMALHLLESGQPILHFVTLDAQINLPLPIPLRVIFGRNSHLNPQQKEGALPGLGADQMRGLLAPVRESVETDGAHGQYFRPANVASLARWVTQGMPDVTPLPLAKGIPWVLENWCDRQVVLTAARDLLPDDLAPLGVVPFLQPSGQTFRLRRGGPHLIAPITANGTRVEVRMTLPEMPGPLSLRPVLCRLGQGPMTWPLHHQPAIHLD